ncbi:hypothetical protein CDD82_4803 [Ophiocordyceps australis]|uniref:Low temperature requirement A n=1 Tax=Ophiocordyceps australis TaxID=1399860 RepID=A0A2C5XJK5_9HYPO|nr:hypothetical protein CDD82_4803 [Ophiocordyceps australis]
MPSSSESDTQHRAEKLRFFTSPVVRRASGNGTPNSPSWASPTTKPSKVENQKFKGTPELQRHQEPTLLEIFYDLFFAANYNTFTDTQQATNKARFKAYTGYFCLLWLTWFLVTLYDVRYVTDSVFARITRAIQLGVLVGFAVVAPKFDSTTQHFETMRTMSLILMFSRICLAVEYASTLWHVRKWPKARMPLCLQIALHSVAAALYLGVTFAFKRGLRSRAFMAWYLMSGIEGVASVLLSNLSPILSLTWTHLMKRMTLLTVMIMGDGIVQVAKEVVTIVKNVDAWNATTIGLVTSAVATIYFVFLVYFDWLRASFHLPAWRQQLWTSLHLPFHLALVLFTQGFTQLLIWGKINDMQKLAGRAFDRESDLWLPNTTTAQVQQHWRENVMRFFQDYPPNIEGTLDIVNNSIANLSSIPNHFWYDVAAFDSTLNETLLDQEDEASMETYFTVLENLLSAMSNALSTAFGIDLSSEVKDKHPDRDIRTGSFQVQISFKGSERYSLVVSSTFLAAAATVFFLVALTVIARTTPHKKWPILRLIIIGLLGLTMGLIAIIAAVSDAMSSFVDSAWVMPSITIFWTIILILTHINGEGIRRNAHIFGARRRAHDTDAYAPISLPLTPMHTWSPQDDKSLVHQENTSDSLPRGPAHAWPSHGSPTVASVENRQPWLAIKDKSRNHHAKQ